MPAPRRRALSALIRYQSERAQLQPESMSRASIYHHVLQKRITSFGAGTDGSSLASHRRSWALFEDWAIVSIAVSQENGREGGA